MPHPKDRVARRAEKRKAKAKARHMLTMYGCLGAPFTGDQVDDRLVGVVADNMKVCSCYMCGNPRKWNGDPTMQEARAWSVEDF